VFADPQSLTINAVATSFPLIKRVGQESTYRSGDAAYTLRISHQENGRNRRVARLDNTKVSTHPLTGLQTEVSSSVYIVVDSAKFGYTDAELTSMVDALKAWLTSANVGRLLDGES
jgi:hypothetical protein